MEAFGVGTTGFNQQEIDQQDAIFAEGSEPAEALQTQSLEAVTDAPRGASWRKLLWLALPAFLIFQFYYVREILAVLVLFAGLFFLVAIVAGIVYAIGRAGESTITAAEPVARRGYELAEEVSKKTFRRPRSAPAP
jgi:hypothetical protein